MFRVLQVQPFTLWNNVYSNFIHPKAHSSRFLQNQHLRVVLLVVDVTDFFYASFKKMYEVSLQSFA